MCLSAEADLLLGAFAVGVGIDSVRHTTSRRQLPLAGLPVVFGVHQIIEVGVWRGLEAGPIAGAGRVAAYAYLVIAFVLPVVAPIAVWAAEPRQPNRRFMLGFAALGVVPTVALLSALARGPMSVSAGHLAVVYSVRSGDAWLLIGAYVVATCGAPLLSGRRPVMLFGVANLVAVAVFATMAADGFISLWCAWAAGISVMIDLEFRSRGASATPPAAVRRGSLGGVGGS